MGTPPSPCLSECDSQSPAASHSWGPPASRESWELDGVSSRALYSGEGGLSRYLNSPPVGVQCEDASGAATTPDEETAQGEWRPQTPPRLWLSFFGFLEELLSLTPKPPGAPSLVKGDERAPSTPEYTSVAATPAPTSRFRAERKPPRLSSPPQAPADAPPAASSWAPAPSPRQAAPPVGEDRGRHSHTQSKGDRQRQTAPASPSFCGPATRGSTKGEADASARARRPLMGPIRRQPETERSKLIAEEEKQATAAIALVLATVQQFLTAVHTQLGGSSDPTVPSQQGSDRCPDTRMSSAVSLLEDARPLSGAPLPSPEGDSRLISLPGSSQETPGGGKGLRPGGGERRGPLRVPIWQVHRLAGDLQHSPEAPVLHQEAHKERARQEKERPWGSVTSPAAPSSGTLVAAAAAAKPPAETAGVSASPPLAPQGRDGGWVSPVSCEPRAVSVSASALGDSSPTLRARELMKQISITQTQVRRQQQEQQESLYRLKNLLSHAGVLLRRVNAAQGHSETTRRRETSPSYRSAQPASPSGSPLGSWLETQRPPTEPQQNLLQEKASRPHVEGWALEAPIPRARGCPRRDRKGDTPRETGCAAAEGEGVAVLNHSSACPVSPAEFLAAQRSDLRMSAAGPPPVVYVVRSTWPKVEIRQTVSFQPHVLLKRGDTPGVHIYTPKALCIKDQFSPGSAATATAAKRTTAESAAARDTPASSSPRPRLIVQFAGPCGLAGGPCVSHGEEETLPQGQEVWRPHICVEGTDWWWPEISLGPDPPCLEGRGAESPGEIVLYGPIKPTIETDKALYI